LHKNPTEKSFCHSGHDPESRIIMDSCLSRNDNA